MTCPQPFDRPLPHFAVQHRFTTAKDHRESRLKNELDKIKRTYDYVFIDNPPALGWLTLNSFTASDRVLVVVSPGYFELDSLGQLGKTLEEVREYFNPGLSLLGSVYHERADHQRRNLIADPSPNLYPQVLRTVIPRNTDLRDALSIRRTSTRSTPVPKQSSPMTGSLGSSFCRMRRRSGLMHTPIKKQLNVDIVTNELRGNSAFFPRYKEEPATPSAAKPAPIHTNASVTHPVPPVRVVPPVPLERGNHSVPKRVMKQRHPFDIYRDQYDALQELALEERKQGGIGSMSAMVREALD